MVPKTALEQFKTISSAVLRSVPTLWPLLLPLAVSMGFPALRRCFHLRHPEGIPPVWYPSHANGAETAAALDIVAVTGLLLATAFITILVAIHILRSRLTPLQLALYTAVGAVVASVAACFIVSSAPLLNIMGRPVFLGTVGAYWARDGQSLDDALKPLESFFHTTNVVAIVTTVIATLAVASLAPPHRWPAQGETLDANVFRGPAEDLAGRIRELKYLLFAASAFMFSGMILLRTWANWPLAFWQGAKPLPPALAAFQEIEASLVTYQSLYYALILVAIFGPMSYWLNVAGQSLAAKVPQADQHPNGRAGWLAQNHLALSLGEQAQRIVAMALPLLAGPTADFVKMISHGS